MNHIQAQKNKGQSVAASRTKNSMKYRETIRERKLRKASGKDFFEKAGDAIADFVESLYWMYYIHLPYYLMTSFDSFCLHTFFLIIFSLSVFGVIKYFLL
ncbi:hypothetical protein HG536_0C03410 [Torulaspora globosa]|uniref:Uncharacterized protein n=1 Tax=Torulaspora globosa TaxID=48254 RepID=A0A7G3ZF87_9SACH|nr:uncharacterized protein HG536_0C03410 [Torulaspora globosa]QLL32173.1 hypothetical protein HG536_0C03410 [Torulaspora globosa]